MSLQQRVSSDHQLARLLQIGAVLEEVIEARTRRHLDTMEVTDEVHTLLEESAGESTEHRQRVEELIDELDTETVPYESIEKLVDEQYANTQPEDFDGVLYDQLCNEETAYKFYDDLIEAIEQSEAEFSIDRDRVLSVLRDIRAEEEAGVEDVLSVMEQQS
ncbi:ferritin-like domain-containing protein [Salinarchaeum sp. IM2453]|uniref:ferritin-like domain-containing protein n=1 Tax=Salinarchaeum sp. IM2453 TaxID=2862870 RepID=UPI001C8286BD|nr:ferritin-like domain-containing protein [Salinarchaeum sp. IM2453]QZA87572.1 ferritin-like domain-containing protein [Salinarchaeum sp. IM2453]